MECNIVVVFALVMTVLFWAVSLEIKTNNMELQHQKLTEYVERLETKVDTDFDIVINKRWE